MESVEQILLKILISKNDAVKRLRLFESKRTQNNKQREIILNNIITMRKQQFLLLAAISESMKSERMFWKMVILTILIR